MNHPWNPKRNPDVPVFRIDEARLRELYADPALTLDEIASALGATVNGVRTAARRLGLVKAPPLAMTSFHVRLPVALLARVKERAEADGLDVAEWVRVALDEAAKDSEWEGRPLADRLPGASIEFRTNAQNTALRTTWAEYRSCARSFAMLEDAVKWRSEHCQTCGAALIVKSAHNPNVLSCPNCGMS